MPAQTQVRPIPASIRGRLDKLMLLLGSSNEGEAANAAALITRLLTAHGLDWHDMVGAIGQVAQNPSGSAPFPPRDAPKKSSSQTLSADEVRELIAAIRHGVNLNVKSHQFLAGMLDRADIYDTIHFSDKQWKWLQDLAARAGVI
jgi:hypothetical protein